jgi:hypothetical protein
MTIHLHQRGESLCTIWTELGDEFPEIFNLYERPDGFAIKMPTTETVGEFVILQFKRMSCVTDQYVTRVRNVAVVQYASTKPALERTLGPPRMVGESKKLHNRSKVSKRTGPTRQTSLFQGCDFLYLYHMYILLSLSLSPHTLIFGPRFFPPGYSKGSVSRESSRILEAYPFLIVSFIKLFAGTTERTTRVFRLKSFLTALSTYMPINYTARAVCPSLRESSRAGQSGGPLTFLECQ